MEKKFELALRRKLRFTYKGSLSLEDLWALRVEELDIFFGRLVKASREKGEVSKLKKETKEDKDLALRLEIVEYILDVKLEEREKEEKATENKLHNEKIMAIIKNKQDHELNEMSIDKLKTLLK